METKIFPYPPVPPELANSGQLVTLKTAAAVYLCSADTLKNNAKLRRLHAYQHSTGSAVLVLPCDVELFLKGRPDIASIYQPAALTPTHTCVRTSTADMSAPWAVGDMPRQPSDVHCPDSAGQHPQPGSFVGGTGGLRLKSLAGATQADLSLVASCFAEISTLINQTLTIVGDHSNI